VAASELDNSRTVDVEYSIITGSSEVTSATDFFSVDSSAGVISTKASLVQFGM